MSDQEEAISANAGAGAHIADAGHLRSKTERATPVAERDNVDA